MNNNVNFINGVKGKVSLSQTPLKNPLEKLVDPFSKNINEGKSL